MNKVNSIIVGLLELLWRYCCSICTALLVFASIIFLGAFAMDKDFLRFLSGAVDHPIYPILSFSLVYTATYAAVSLGTFCVPHRSRIMASGLIMMLGIITYLSFWYLEWRHEFWSKHGNEPRVLPILFGGAFATLAAVSSGKDKLALANNAPVANEGMILLHTYRRWFMIGIGAGVVFFLALLFVSSLS